jgi:hypothetical protein
MRLEVMTSVIDRATPAVAVLLTGDGGFDEYADRTIEKGWEVEALYLADGISRTLKTHFGESRRQREVRHLG